MAMTEIIPSKWGIWRASEPAQTGGLSSDHRTPVRRQTTPQKAVTPPLAGLLSGPASPVESDLSGCPISPEHRARASQSECVLRRVCECHAPIGARGLTPRRGPGRHQAQPETFRSADVTSHGQKLIVPSGRNDSGYGGTCHEGETKAEGRGLDRDCRYAGRSLGTFGGDAHGGRGRIPPNGRFPAANTLSASLEDSSWQREGRPSMDGTTVAGVVLILFLAIASIAWHFRRSRSLLDRWAEGNEFRILQSEYRHIFRGPFFWTSSKGQTVYRVTVEDRAGNVRSGWVRCGGWWLGLWSDNVEARWDEAPPKAGSAMRDDVLDAPGKMPPRGGDWEGWFQGRSASH